MKFIVKVFNLDGQEMDFKNTVIGQEKEVSFKINKKGSKTPN